MPELPEVQTTIDGITPFLLDEKILRCNVSVKKLRWDIQKNICKDLVNLKIRDVSRRAKYIIISGEKFFLTIHLGMTGTLRIANKQDKVKKHDHFEILLSSGNKLRFNDPRKFGMIFLSKDSPLETNRLFLKLGVEPLNKEFNSKFLYEKTRKRSIPIKTLLMNASIIVGVGNIYASESLFLAGIRPQKVSNKLTKRNCEDLVISIKKVLRKAIKKGGSTINDYINANGKTGYFQYDFKVYGRTSLPCHNCQSDILQVKISQRSSFYCKNCQK